MVATVHPGDLTIVEIARGHQAVTIVTELKEVLEAAQISVVVSHVAVLLQLFEGGAMPPDRVAVEATRLLPIFHDGVG